MLNSTRGKKIDRELQDWSGELASPPVIMNNTTQSMHYPQQHTEQWQQQRADQLEKQYEMLRY